MAPEQLPPHSSCGEELPVQPGYSAGPQIIPDWESSTSINSIVLFTDNAWKTLQVTHKVRVTVHILHYGGSDSDFLMSWILKLCGALAIFTRPIKKQDFSISNHQTFWGKRTLSGQKNMGAMGEYYLQTQENLNVSQATTFAN